MPKLKENIKKISTKQGLFLGLILLVVNLGLYLYGNFTNNWSPMVNQWFQFGKFLIIIGFGIWTTILCRKAYMKTLNFQDGFSGFFITVLIGYGLYVLSNWILLSVYDPDAGRILTDQSALLIEDRLTKLGQPEEKVKQAVEDLYENPPFSFKSQFTGYVFNLVLYCLPAAIVAFILKTKNPIIR